MYVHYCQFLESNRMKNVKILEETVLFSYFHNSDIGMHITVEVLNIMFQARIYCGIYIKTVSKRMRSLQSTSHLNPNPQASRDRWNIHHLFFFPPKFFKRFSPQNFQTPKHMWYCIKCQIPIQNYFTESFQLKYSLTCSYFNHWRRNLQLQK